MEKVLNIDDKYYLEILGKKLVLNVDSYSVTYSNKITKEKAKEIIEFLTKFVDGE